jgi:hypothetical protein
VRRASLWLITAALLSTAALAGPSEAPLADQDDDPPTVTTGIPAGPDGLLRAGVPGRSSDARSAPRALGAGAAAVRPPTAGKRWAPATAGKRWNSA